MRPPPYAPFLTTNSSTGSAFGFSMVKSMRGRAYPKRIPTKFDKHITDRPTNGRMDGWTNVPSHRDARRQLTSQKWIQFAGIEKCKREKDGGRDAVKQRYEKAWKSIDYARATPLINYAIWQKIVSCIKQTCCRIIRVSQLHRSCKIVLHANHNCMQTTHCVYTCRIQPQTLIQVPTQLSPLAMMAHHRKPYLETNHAKRNTNGMYLSEKKNLCKLPSYYVVVQTPREKS